DRKDMATSDASARADYQPLALQGLAKCPDQRVDPLGSVVEDAARTYFHDVYVGEHSHHRRLGRGEQLGVDEALPHQVRLDVVAMVRALAHRVGCISRR